MKLNDLVSFRRCRDKRVAFGVLVEINLRQGVGVIMRDGKRHVRDLKRIKTSEVGMQEHAFNVARDQKRRMPG